MKYLHFETLSPTCPRCRNDFNRESSLKIRTILKESKDSIQEGILSCTNESCQMEFPIIDSIPILVADLRSYISQNLSAILSRTDLSESIESLIGDCDGPNGSFDIRRQHLSSYTFDHYGDFDPQETKKHPTPPGSLLMLFENGLKKLGKIKEGPIVDMGCSVGRTSLELARKFDCIVLGIDLNFDMLRLGSQILSEDEVSYPRRRIGLVYDRRRFPIQFSKRHQVDFWACDATTLPFVQNTFSLACSWNLLDCVKSPYDFLKELNRVLQGQGKAIITSPYDWSPGATSVENWIGGHSQRSEMLGSAEPFLRSLMAGGGHPKALEELELISEENTLPWSVRIHDRSVMQYIVHMVVAKSKK